jgi:hypothetical protein
VQLLENISNWLLSNSGPIIYLIIGSLLGLLASWFTARYSWKSQKADERRERVYAPLSDELDPIKKALENYDYFHSTEYDRLASAHLLYLVPSAFRMQIRELYAYLATFSLMGVKLRQKYEDRILKEINDSLPSGSQPNAYNDSNAKTLAQDIAYFLLQGKIATSWRKEPLLKDIGEQLGWKEPIEPYFEKFRGILTKDQDMIELETLQKKILHLLKPVQETIMSDLESQF